MKNKYAQSITDAFSQFIETSRRKPNLLETDDSKVNINKIFTDFFLNHNFKKYSRDTALRAVVAEIFDRTKRDFSKKAVF